MLVVAECEPHEREELTSDPGVSVCEEDTYEVVCLVVFSIIRRYRTCVTKTIQHIEDARGTHSPQSPAP